MPRVPGVAGVAELLKGGGKAAESKRRDFSWLVVETQRRASWPIDAPFAAAAIMPSIFVSATEAVLDRDFSNRFTAALRRAARSRVGRVTGSSARSGNSLTPVMPSLRRAMSLAREAKVASISLATQPLVRA